MHTEGERFSLDSHFNGHDESVPPKMAMIGLAPTLTFNPHQKSNKIILS